MKLVLGLVVATLVSIASAQAQTSAPQKPVRILIANGKLGSVVDAPLHFKLLQVAVAASQSTTFLGGNAMVYPTAGAVTVEIDGEAKTLQDGDGAFIPAGKSATLKAAGGRANHISRVCISCRGRSNKNTEWETGTRD